ncbi:MAG: NUDIX hydrolase [Candidatus Schekmanbacteria bacterium RBG_16_38_11]|uniref:NUDIX hydrolase n=2 Tax=Candidatus Schekmaniibacteriota TaxID=1817811 RepID=A0A1F7RJS9_9BACT|nr:MAG: NUDIX hydrolase [Candidatus Schekmanbacteria bacterium GWA2_38_11]OGL44456.1 MAG: NUDIX hydrolase [Candidatus Schekmanbacteria bacterium RBG_16_38_11]
MRLYLKGLKLLKGIKKCPNCGKEIEVFKNPVPTVDVIIETEVSGEKGIVLIYRKNPPHGWAIPGGYVDYGETVESCAEREAFEETSLKVKLLRQFHTYSDPCRDERQHTISTVFIAKAKSGEPKASTDAAKIGVFTKNNLPQPLVFDHAGILEDYFSGKY